MGVARAVAATPAKPLTQTKAVSKSRISSIDVMRGLVMVLMLLDHVREKLYLHVQVSDPMDETIGPVVAPDESLAQALLRSLLATSSGFVRVDVPANERKLTACLASCGLVQVDRGLLMTRGKWPSSRNSVRRFALVSQALG